MLLAHFALVVYHSELIAEGTLASDLRQIEIAVLRSVLHSLLLLGLRLHLGVGLSVLPAAYSR